MPPRKGKQSAPSVPHHIIERVERDLVQRQRESFIETGLAEHAQIEASILKRPRADSVHPSPSPPQAVVATPSVDVSSPHEDTSMAEKPIPPPTPAPDVLHTLRIMEQVVDSLIVDTSIADLSRVLFIFFNFFFESMAYISIWTSGVILIVPPPLRTPGRSHTLQYY
jgi:hypothetical protein